MDTDHITQNAPAKPATDEVVTPKPTDVPLDRVVESVRQDSIKNPERYAKETEIPGGGE